ncbi:MAG: PAM68 family protein [Synechococcales bacterium]|nr:PAM68 family protein [Synechococcales bacterium]
MSSDPQEKKAGRDRLPFEPTANRKKAEKKPPVAPASAPKTAKPSVNETSSKPRDRAQGSSLTSATSIPDAVSRRMVKRMAFFCGIPTLIGFSSFFVSYYVVVNDLFELPTTAVLIVSLAFFGLGIIGLSYGALSASWDETPASGSLLGWNNFTTNLGRMRQAWKESRNQSKA